MPSRARSDDTCRRDGSTRMHRPGEKDRAPVHRRRTRRRARRTSGARAGRARRAAARSAPCRGVGRRPRQQPRHEERREHEHRAAATTGNCAARRDRRAAAPAATPEPASSPKLHTPCSAESTGLPSRCSSATPCAFAPTSAMPTPAPSTHAIGHDPANDGANAAAREPRRGDEQAERGRPTAAAARRRASRRPAASTRRRQRDREDDERRAGRCRGRAGASAPGGARPRCRRARRGRRR